MDGLSHERFSKRGDGDFRDFQEFHPKPVHIPLIHSMKTPDMRGLARLARAQP
jgi:hypothetical protein